MLLKNKHDNRIYEAKIVSWLNKPLSKTQPEVFIYGYGFLPVEGHRNWSIVEADATQREMLVAADFDPGSDSAVSNIDPGRDRGLAACQRPPREKLRR